MDGMTPVTVAFCDKGMLITAIKKGQPFIKTLTWKDLYKIGLKGKCMKESVFLRQVSEKAEAIVKANKEHSANNEKWLNDLKKMRESRPSVPPRAQAGPTPSMPQVVAVPLPPPPGELQN